MVLRGQWVVGTSKAAGAVKGTERLVACILKLHRPWC